MSVEAIQGVWIDRSRATAAEGLTLTLSSRWGTLLVSALTVAVGAAGGAAWSIVAFALHQIRCKNVASSALFHQQQVILRNPPSSAGAAWELLRLSSVWKGHTPRAAWRSWRLIFWPLLVLSIFTVAGIFVGKVATPAYKVNNIRLKPNNCGFVQTTTGTGFSATQAFSKKVANDNRIAAAYVDSCYGSASGTLGCSVLPVQSLKHQESFVPCPFGGLNRCVSETLMMDSGYIDSNIHLGINDEASNSILMRMVNTCSVINVANEVVFLPDISGVNGSDYLVEYFFLGPVVNVTNYTYTYLTRVSEARVSYSLFSIYDNEDSVWQPIEDLDLANADVSLHFFHINSIGFDEPVLDPFFSANGTATLQIDGGTIYLADKYTTVMACTDQREYKNPVTNVTTGLDTYVRAYNRSVGSLGFNDAQKATAGRVALAQFSVSTYNVVSGQGVNSLQATKQIYEFISAGLPPNQWQLEVSRWFQTGLANLQQRITDFATNPWDTGNINEINVKSPYSYTDSVGKESAKQCRQQRVQSTDDYMNFSFVGVLVIITVAPTLILVSWILEGCVEKYKNRQRTDGGIDGAKRHKLRAYIADGKLVLLRQALKGGGYSVWQGGKSTRPYRLESEDNNMPPIKPAREDEESIFYSIHDDIEMAETVGGEDERRHLIQQHEFRDENPGE